MSINSSDSLTHKKPLNHIVLLRVIAIVLVVLGHATRSIYTPNPHLYGSSYTPWLEIFVKQYIYSFHMPLFFWISGYVYYYTIHKNSYKVSILGDFFKKTKRLIIPLYAISFLILLPTMLLFGHINIPFWKQIVLMLQMQSNDHLWFLEALFVIFLVAIPLLSYIKSSLVALVIMILVPLLLYGTIHFPLNWLNYLFQYFPYFMLGFITRKIEREMKLKILSLTALFLLTSHFVVFYLLQHNSLLAEKYYSYGVAILGIYAFYYMSYALSKIEYSPSAWKKIEIVDDASYTIYLFPVVFLYLVLYINHLLAIENSIFHIVAIFVLGMGVPLWIHTQLSKNRYMAFLFSVPYREQKDISNV